MGTNAEVSRLQALLKEKEESLMLSANIGKNLLQTNNDLSERCEHLIEEYSKTIEALEQEKYALTMRLSTKEKMEKVAQDEWESQQSQHRKETEYEMEQVHVKHVRIVHELQANLKGRQADLEIAAKTEEQLQETITKQEEMLQNAYDKIKSMESVMTPSTDDNEELVMLRHENNDLKSNKDFLEMELKRSQDELEKFNLVVEGKDQLIHDLEEEKEEERRQGTSYYNALEKSREEVMDLKVQLDAAQMESMDHKTKGNSLFGEVEDRRKESDRKLISMKVRYETVKENLSTYKQQVHRLKFQIAGLLQMSGGMADAAQIERLEQALSQRDGENEILNSKISRMERHQNAGKDEQLDAFCTKMKEMQGSHHQVGNELIDLLRSKLKDANDKVEKVTKELQNERMLVMASSDSLLATERRLYVAETEASGLKATNLKANLKLDELRFKLKMPDPNATKGKVQEYYIEKIPLPPAKSEELSTSEATSTTGTVVGSTVSQPTAAVSSIGQTSTSSDDYRAQTGECSGGAGAGTSVVPKLRLAPKKSVRMCESVSSLDETGQVLETTQLKTGNERQSGMKRHTAGDSEEIQSSSDTMENSEPLQGAAAGGRKRPKGRKQIKVADMTGEAGEPMFGECKQQ